MKIKQQFSKCATVLAVVATIGQASLAPAQALASELEATEQSTTESIVDQEQVSEESNTSNASIIDLTPVVDIPTSESDEAAEATVDPVSLIGRSTTSYAYTTDGDVISYPRQSMTREIGNSTVMLTKEYANGAFVTTGYITVSGEENGPAWCIEPDKPFPVNIEYAKSVYQDEGVFNILYYAALNGWDQQNEHYVDVFVALNAYLGHSYGGVPLNSPTFTTDPTVAYLLQKTQDKDAPAGSFDIENKVQTADFELSTKIQKTDWYTPVADSENTTYDIPTDSFDSAVSVELSDGRTLQAKTGTHTISSQVKFRLVANAAYEKEVKFTVNSNKLKVAALSFKPVGVDGQTIVKAGAIKDPISIPDVTATFFARLGKVKVAKTDGVTGKFVPGTVFDVIAEGKTFTVTTGADGTYELPEEFVHGTTGQIIEKSVPSGYVLDTTPLNFTIEAGETVTVTQKNDIQKAVATFEKEVEVFDAEKTKETGLPVYENIPLEGGEFTIENVNDTTAPDQETVLTPAG
ncbi:SpaA isopeptide-forming pilin-related protein, partial [Enterococcus larvae]|uniref:SpaA isopeptide-forming pilin-related protein n=1 Tax=Enterococcus larvae TaxID=2794352 RepID=UPI003F2A9D22